MTPHNVTMRCILVSGLSAVLFLVIGCQTPTLETRAKASGRADRTSNAGTEEILHVQRILAELGYGTRFTGVMDDSTRTAIQEFERHHGLPERGILTDAIKAQLAEDASAANWRSSEVARSRLEQVFAGWDSGYFHASGNWSQVIGPEELSPGFPVDLTCFQDKALCIEAHVFIDKSPDTLFYTVKSWDKDEIVASHSPGCVNTVLTVNRVAEQVLVTSSPISSPGCNASRRAFEIEPAIRSDRLVDGLRGFTSYDAKKRKAEREAIRLSGTAAEITRDAQ